MEAMKYRAMRWLCGQEHGVMKQAEKIAGLTAADELSSERFEALADAAVTLAPADVVGSVWKPIETAPATGDFLVKGGGIESKLHECEPLDSAAYVYRDRERFVVRHGVYYSSWVNNPTHWAEIPE